MHNQSFIVHLPKKIFHCGPSITIISFKIFFVTVFKNLLLPIFHYKISRKCIPLQPFHCRCSITRFPLWIFHKSFSLANLSYQFSSTDLPQHTCCRSRSSATVFPLQFFRFVLPLEAVSHRSSRWIFHQRCLTPHLPGRPLRGQAADEVFPLNLRPSSSPGCDES